MSGGKSVRPRCVPGCKLRHIPGDAEDALSAGGIITGQPVNQDRDRRAGGGRFLRNRSGYAPRRSTPTGREPLAVKALLPAGKAGNQALVLGEADKGVR